MTTRMIAATLVLFVACGTPAQPQTVQPTGTLDQALAPIALYPDSLLAQMLMSATDPAKVTELDKWLKANQKLKGTQLQDAAVKAGFETELRRPDAVSSSGGEDGGADRVDDAPRKSFSIRQELPSLTAFSV
jgi:hypothetical protein